jgi:hypothetical protein
VHALLRDTCGLRSANPGVRFRAGSSNERRSKAAIITTASGFELYFSKELLKRKLPCAVYIRLVR